jgi:dihydrofolate reductase/thymidylate synthase
MGSSSSKEPQNDEFTLLGDLDYSFAILGPPKSGKHTLLKHILDSKYPPSDYNVHTIRSVDQLKLIKQEENTVIVADLASMSDVNDMVHILDHSCANMIMIRVYIGDDQKLPNYAYWDEYFVFKSVFLFSPVKCSNLYRELGYRDDQLIDGMGKIPYDFVKVTTRTQITQYYPSINLAEKMQDIEEAPNKPNENLERSIVVARGANTDQRLNPLASSVVIAPGDPVARTHPEYQYLDMMQKILSTGTKRLDDRAGVGTFSLFGCTMRFDLSNDDTFPLLTTKRMFWKGVVEELLWFIRGDTNANHLREKNVNIWNANGSREFLDNRGLSHREEGDLGPIYGFQWRHFGAKYVDMHANYEGQGFDQLSDCIHKIKTNPSDRRIIMTAWNPSDLNEMALPPCHMFCQFYVAEGKLSCLMYQRSCDMGLGVPFNIASYALLTRMMAQVCGLVPGEFIHMLGDAHIYLNHVTAIHEQLKRVPRVFPKLTINPDKKDIDSFMAEDFKLSNYNPYPSIQMDMVA